VKWHERILQAVRLRNQELARAEMIGHIEAAETDLLGSEDKLGG
jgi:DNA-binding FadR family transcriptional regulator